MTGHRLDTGGQGEATSLLLSSLACTVSACGFNYTKLGSTHDRYYSACGTDFYAVRQFSAWGQ